MEEENENSQLATKIIIVTNLYISQKPSQDYIKMTKQELPQKINSNANEVTNTLLALRARKSQIIRKN